MEKCNNDCVADTRLKTISQESADITKTLGEVGMEDMAVISDQLFLFESKDGRGLDPPVMRWKEMSFF